MKDVSVGSASVESLIAELADEYRERLERGERPDVEEYARRYPHLAPVVRQVLASLELIRVSARPPDLGCEPPRCEAEVPGWLGDFRLLREIGRGGMGVVYEAEQLSLGRRVALKVLPFAATLDPKQLQRFKNEAQAAAGLHHSHIVPVHAVGIERGVHYYAMQFIDGQNLAAVIEELRLMAGLEALASGKPPQGPSTGIKELAVGCQGPAPPHPAEKTPPPGAHGTAHSLDSPAHWRTVAQLGVQAAEALEHAHQLGVVHRDIKPANLLVDARSHLWITDFGLAHCQSDARLTLTGHVVGTLRYMSPEQAGAMRRPVDHRTDIYSLGATLYELLTLEPVFDGRGREELLCQIALIEPRPLRRVRKAVPTDLETVVLKALAKDPDERYTTAQELADDLRRFLEHKPLRAKPPTLLQRARKWARRHTGLV
jgi:serine/threonine protein kinase